jgi:hypothetical protein
VVFFNIQDLVCFELSSQVYTLILVRKSVYERFFDGRISFVDSGYCDFVGYQVQELWTQEAIGRIVG